MRFLSLAAGALLLALHTVALSPVVLINGLGGAAIRAKLVNKTSNPNVFCSTNSDWYTLWLNPAEFVPPARDCLMDNMTPRFDSSTGKYYAPQGVTLDTNYDFGGTQGIAYLDPSLQLSAVAYFGPLIDLLTSKYGYQVGTSVRGAPYDWRMGPDGLGDYFTKLQSLIEETYQLNGNGRVLIVTHSMGGPVGLYFLNQMSASWKEKFVQAFIPIAPPFGGAALVLRSSISGYNFGISIFPHDYLWPVQVNSPSGVFLLPDPSIFTGTLISTPSKNYTSSDYKQLVKDIGEPTAIAFFDQAWATAVHTLKAPLVDTHVFYGSGISTAVGYTYSADIQAGTANSDPSQVSSEDGDGTVPLRSATVYQSWESAHTASGFQLTGSALSNQTHLGMLTDTSSLQIIAGLIMQLAPQILEQ